MMQSYEPDWLYAAVIEKCRSRWKTFASLGVTETLHLRPASVMSHKADHFQVILPLASSSLHFLRDQFYVYLNIFPSLTYIAVRNSVLRFDTAHPVTRMLL